MVNIRKPSTLPKQDCSICTSTIPACTFTSLKFTVVSVNYIHIESQNQNPMIIRVRVLLRVSSLTLFSYFAEARFIQRQGKVWHLYIYVGMHKICKIHFIIMEHKDEHNKQRNCNYSDTRSLWIYRKWKYFQVS